MRSGASGLSRFKNIILYRLRPSWSYRVKCKISGSVKMPSSLLNERRLSWDDTGWSGQCSASWFPAACYSFVIVVFVPFTNMTCHSRTSRAGVCFLLATPRQPRLPWGHPVHLHAFFSVVYNSHSEDLRFSETILKCVSRNCRSSPFPFLSKWCSWTNSFKLCL